MKEINLGFDGGTVALMEWIRENNYPALHAAFCLSESKRYTLIVSSYTPNESDLVRDEWFEWKGMKRHFCYPVKMWVMNIDGHWYYATPY